jgi:hypothetical protein
MGGNLLVINVDIRETRVALVENGIIAELHIERESSRSTLGNLYLGVVSRVLPGMQAAFIDIGQERAAFLHVEDLIRPDDFDAYHTGPVGGAAQPPTTKRPTTSSWSRPTGLAPRAPERRTVAATKRPSPTRRATSRARTTMGLRLRRRTTTRRPEPTATSQGRRTMGLRLRRRTTREAASPSCRSGLATAAWPSKGTKARAGRSPSTRPKTPRHTTRARSQALRRAPTIPWPTASPRAGGARGVVACLALDGRCGIAARSR